MKIITIIVLATACSSAFADAVYKCEVAGKKIYSDQPCGGKESLVAGKPVKPAPVLTLDELRARVAATMLTLPRIGMREEDIPATTDMARPIVKVNVTQTAAGVSKQYVIGRTVGIQSYIYTVNGIVTAIQH